MFWSLCLLKEIQTILNCVNEQPGCHFQTSKLIFEIVSWGVLKVWLCVKTLPLNLKSLVHFLCFHYGMNKIGRKKRNKKERVNTLLNLGKAASLCHVWKYIEKPVCLLLILVFHTLSFYYNLVWGSDVDILTQNSVSHVYPLGVNILSGL